MGRELGALYHSLNGELVWMNWEWAQFTKLFATKPARLDLMNETAPFFFSVVQRVFWQNTLLGLARVAGPARSAGKDNLSIRRLPDAIADLRVRSKVQRLVNRSVRTSKFTITWRNKQLAHRDLRRALGRRAGRLPRADRARVDAALSSVADVLNAIQQHFEGSTTAYNFSATIWDADSLLTVLRDGRIRERLRERRLEAGEYNPEDWNDDLPPV